MWIVKNYVEKNTNRYFTGEEELIYAGIAINTIKGDFPVIILELNEKSKKCKFLS